MNRRSGFTIIELLIVIAVIAVLAAITIVAYNGIQQRAQIASVSDGLTKVGKAFKLWMIKEDTGVWPDEPTYGGGTALSNMIADNPGLRKNLQSVPEVKGVGTEEWFYDNDVVETEPSSRCGDPYNGVNIVIKYIDNEAIAKGVDKQLDDGDYRCGRIKYVNKPNEGILLFYNLAYSKDEMNY